MIETDNCHLVDIVAPKSGDYLSVRLASTKVKNQKKSVAGQYKKAGIDTPLRFLKELRFQSSGVEVVEEGGKRGLKLGEATLFIGDKIMPSAIFKVGDKVAVTSRSKGKGFQGVVKRHGFAGGPKTHGQSDRHRAPGSIGQTTTPGKVYRGKRMAGRMGGVQKTVRGLTVFSVTDSALVVTGLIPGAKSALVSVRSISS